MSIARGSEYCFTVSDKSWAVGGGAWESSDVFAKKL
jgi:hypothetical protein